MRIADMTKSAIRPVVAVGLAGIIGAVILMVSGANPINAYMALFQGALGSVSGIGRTLEKATPLILNGLAVAFALKAGLFNIGTQGQLLIGALVAAIAGFSLHGLPAAVHCSLALVAGAFAGGIYASIKGILKACTGTHEVISGIMLNYVAINLTDYFAAGPFRDSSAGNIIARTPRILETAMIPHIGNIPFGFYIALFSAVGVWMLFRHTTLGFEILTLGHNRHAAQYAGINISWALILTMIMSGILAGLGGAIETQGLVYRFQPGFNVGLGFDGITIALLARIHPLGVVPAAILVGGMRAGTGQMQFDVGVVPEIVDVMQALILFFVSADALTRWITGFKDKAEERINLAAGWGKI